MTCFSGRLGVAARGDGRRDVFDRRRDVFAGRLGVAIRGDGRRDVFAGGVVVAVGAVGTIFFT